MVFLPKTLAMGTEGIRDRYINPYTDFGFKKIFGSDMNKDLLVSFLNALLDGRERIENLTYLNVEHLGNAELDRKAVFDVYCQNDKGEKFLVEMQKGEQEFFKRRGTWDYSLKAVYTIGILNFVFDESDKDTYRHQVRLVDTDTGEVFYDKLTFIYLEMPKFNKREEELETMFDKWMFVLRNLSSLFDRPKALQERVFTRLFEAAEIAKFDRVEYAEYQESLKNFRDLYSVIQTASRKGMAEGLAEGMAKGLAEGMAKGLEQGRQEGEKAKAQDIARRLRASGLMSSEEIARATGLDMADIPE